MVNPKVYYRLDNFYANYRQYIRSRDWKQLRGIDQPYAISVPKCDPVFINDNLLDEHWYKQTELSVFPFKGNNTANPCGLIAKYRFDDQFVSISDRNGLDITIDDSNIAHSLEEKRFVINDDVKLRGDYWTDVTNQHFKVWFQMESLNDFVKLYGSINQTLKKDTTYSITVQDNFDSMSIGSNKFIYLSEIGIFGGNNLFLAWVLLGSAAYIIVILFVFFIFYFAKLHRRNRENEDFLKTLRYI